MDYQTLSDETLLTILHERFDTHPIRHPDLSWQDVTERLTPQVLKTVKGMELTGGEPDVLIDQDGTLLYCDCSPESPSGRRSLCYDAPALEARKKNKPSGSALGLAETLGITLLDETMYRHLQTFGAFDLKSSSWIATPHAIRIQGGALFCDRRYDHVFVYHNGADSYYAARAFRGYVRL